MIKGKHVTTKEAIRVLKKRLTHKNPNVQLLTISLVDSCSKNSGFHFVQEMCSRDFVDTIARVCDGESVQAVKSKLLEYLQIWALSFRGKEELNYIVELYDTMRRDGRAFPLKPDIQPSIFDTITAPEWKESPHCSRCRSQFTLTNRVHHCRNCGNAVCNACSSKRLELPNYGFNDPVRVCETCYSSKVDGRSVSNADNMFPGQSHHVSNDDPENDSDLDLAIKLSLDEAKPKVSDNYLQKEEEDMLAAAIAASLKEEEKQRPTKYESYESYYQPESNDSKSYYQPEETYSSHALPEPELVSQDEKQRIVEFHRIMKEAERTGNFDSRMHEMYSQVLNLDNKLKYSMEVNSDNTEKYSEQLSSIKDAIANYDRLFNKNLSPPNQYYQPQYPVYPPSQTDYPYQQPVWQNVHQQPMHSGRPPLESGQSHIQTFQPPMHSIQPQVQSIQPHMQSFQPESQSMPLVQSEAMSQVSQLSQPTSSAQNPKNEEPKEEAPLIEF